MGVAALIVTKAPFPMKIDLMWLRQKCSRMRWGFIHFTLIHVRRLPAPFSDLSRDVFFPGQPNKLHVYNEWSQGFTCVWEQFKQNIYRSSRFWTLPCRNAMYDMFNTEKPSVSISLGCLWVSKRTWSQFKEYSDEYFEHAAVHSDGAKVVFPLEWRLIHFDW